MAETINVTWLQLGLTSIIIGLTIVFGMNRIITKKADKTEMARVEQQSIERDDKLGGRIIQFDEKITKKLNEHQKEIVANNKEMYQEIIKLIKESK